MIKMKSHKDIAVYLLKPRPVGPEKQQLLVNGSETTFVSRQWLQNRQHNDVSS
jgi:hypothetical protein